MSVKSGDIDRILRKLEMKVRNGKDVLAWFMHEGRPVLFTRRSFGRGDVGNIAHFIRQQLKVNEDQFAGLRDCPLSRNDYIEILKKKGYIS